MTREVLYLTIRLPARTIRLTARSSDDAPRDFRRPFLLALSLGLLLGGIVMRLLASDSSGDWRIGASAMMIRVGIAFGALWLAWPSLQRPVRWLPPGAAAAVLIFIGAAVARPALLPALIPIAGGLATLAAVVRLIRGPADHR